MPVPRITAVICTYNRYSMLRLALASLTAQTLPAGDFEIIVVDNSPDHAQSRIEAAAFEGIPNLRWIVELTAGLSNARNRGAAMAAGSILAFLDDDAVADPVWLARILASFERFGEGAAVLGGRVEPLWRAPRPCWLHDDLLGYVSVVNWGGVARIAAPHEWFAGANIAFRRGPLLDAGGFTAALGRRRDGPVLLSNEESEVLARLRASGFAGIYDPEAVVKHAVGPDRLTQPWFRRRAAWQATSDFMMDSDQRIRQAKGAWQSVGRFINCLPPRERSLRALSTPQDAPEMFKAQIAAIYCYTVLILAGFPQVEP